MPALVGNDEIRQSRKGGEPRHHDLPQLVERIGTGPIDLQPLHRTDNRDVCDADRILSLSPERAGEIARVAPSMLDVFGTLRLDVGELIADHEEADQKGVKDRGELQGRETAAVAKKAASETGEIFRGQHGSVPA